MQKKFIVRLFIVLLTVSLLLAVVPATTFATTEQVVSTFTDSGAVLVNPYMGFAPRATGGPYSLPHSLVFTYVSWADIEPTKGVYDFASFERENKFDYWKSLGVKIIFRIHCDFPSQSDHIDIPQWLYNETRDGIHYNNAYGMGYSPNYANVTYIAAHKRLIQAFANRYNNDSFVAQIEIGSVGHWGEWHTYKGSSGTNVPFPKKEIADQYAQHYADAFTNKPLSIRRPTQVALDNNMSLFNDSIGDYDQVYTWFLDWTLKGYVWWLTGEPMPAMPNYWRNAMVGGESMLGFTNNLSDANVQKTMQQVSDLRLSYWKTGDTAYANLSSTVQSRIADLKKRIGYRFLISSSTIDSEVVAGSDLSVGLTIENKGVAPFYNNWPLQINVVGADGETVASKIANLDIRNVFGVPVRVSEEVAIPVGINSGKYNVSVSILNPATMKSGIALANGSPIIGSVQVVSAAVPTPIPTPVPTIVPTPTPIPVSVPASITLYGASSLTVYTGKSISQFNAVVRDKNGKELYGEAKYYFISVPKAGVSVNSSTGLVTILPSTRKGSFTLSARSVSNPSLVHSKVVTLVKK